MPAIAVLSLAPAGTPSKGGADRGAPRRNPPRHGRALSARLVVAADSRFSEMRRIFGIPTRMRDFGRSMLVCRAIHEVPHDHTAWEWFDHGQTLALLPLGREGDPRNRSSAVLTLPAACMDELQSMGGEAFGRIGGRPCRSISRPAASSACSRTIVGRRGSCAPPC
ncbi:hypothetical protein [Inquilinus sp. OTU3971]|uniref:hypothetical protein n=1 Tax=Inquilinus sp. OTU3971 TaxID=3043855 RepID=UPI00313F0613